MKTIASPSLLQRQALRWRAAGIRIALVPTMGALHAGHGALMQAARRKVGKKGKVIVSIYVNPTQFGPKEDLARYPRPRRADTAFCRREKVDLLFAPMNLYAPDHSTWVLEEMVSQGRDGASRPHHFKGVTTVVAKLFAITQPHLAFFGRKDAQQLEVIQRMVRDLNMPIEIIPIETVRDRDGLALSSRNRFLSADERNRALALPLLLQAAVLQRQPVRWLQTYLSRLPGLKVDYVAAEADRLCAAVWIGKTRLIDNIALSQTLARIN